MVDFSCREEAPCDFGAIRLRPHVFHVNADVAVSGDGDEDKIGRVREIEFEAVAEFRAEVGLAECVVDKAHAVRLGLEIAPQEVAQYSVRDDETPPIALESKTRAPVAFIRREARVQASGCCRRNVHAGAPAMHFVGRHLKRARR